MHLHDDVHDHNHHHREYDKDYHHERNIHTHIPHATDEIFERHHQNDPTGKNHGHRHNKLIDTILELINEDSKLPESHNVYLLELYYHLKPFYSIGDMDIPESDKKRSSGKESMSNLLYPSPPEPPPRVFLT